MFRLQWRGGYRAKEQCWCSCWLHPQFCCGLCLEIHIIWQDAGVAEDVCSGWDVSVGIPVPQAAGTWGWGCGDEGTAAKALQCPRSAWAQSLPGVRSQDRIATTPQPYTGIVTLQYSYYWNSSEAVYWTAIAKMFLSMFRLLLCIANLQQQLLEVGHQ